MVQVLKTCSPKKISEGTSSKSQNSNLLPQGLFEQFKLALIGTLFSILLTTSETASVCQYRDHETLAQRLQAHQYGNDQSVHHTFFSSPDGIAFINSQLQASGDMMSNGMGDRGTAGKCGPKLGGYLVNEMSLCSWHHRINLDIDRYPQAITEAYRDTGACKDCHKSDTETLSPATHTCVPVYFNIPVLRRRNACDSDGYYEYEESWQKVKVGYTCSSVNEM